MQQPQHAALVLTAPRQLAFEPVSAAPLEPGQVRLKTLFSGISAGTELSQYRGTSPFMNRRWDADFRLFAAGENPSWSFPVRNLGYEEAGLIVETGSAVTRVRTGQHVFGTWGHRTTHVMAEEDAGARLIPDGADPRIGIFSHIGAVALNGVHDARIRIGDLVVVFGLGVPGQIVAQAARAAGATVFGVDPAASRRAMARRHGADRVLDPAAGSIADTVKSETAGRGADVCIEVSGVPAALAEAMRTVAYSSRVVAMGFSHSTCLPEAAAASTAPAWRAWGRQTETASTSGWASAACQSGAHSPPNSAAKARPRASSTSATATIRQSGSVR